MPTETSTCDRYGISDRAAAAIVSSVWHDISSHFGVDKSKIRLETKTGREELRKLQKQLLLSALCLDDRKDKTVRIVKEGVKQYK